MAKHPLYEESPLCGPQQEFLGVYEKKGVYEINEESLKDKTLALFPMPSSRYAVVYAPQSNF
jgi:hypothetical protein